ncbi:hypothetical protein AMR74_16660 [Halorubrum tropicale]|uniref:Uncharacterized protein n=2 Tax=Halorubrum tropicale TaxID=1765655 RepID=A0A0M9ALT1_9EURY|nr:hypothetical protein AMR74_16660 [Halorubrum tropicale]
MDGPINDIGIEISDQTRAFAIKYELDDYATALVETAEGEVVSEATASPEGNEVILPYQGMGAGEYKFVIRRDGDTVDTVTRSFSGPEAQILSVTDTWDESRLDGFDATIENSGDMPVLIDRVGVDLETKDEVAYGWNEFVEPGETTTVGLDFNNYQLQFAEGGDVGIEVSIETASGTTSKTVSHSLEPATPEFESITPLWNGVYLNVIEMTLENTGDVPLEAYAEASSTSSTVESHEFTIDPGNQKTIQARSRGFERLYEAEAGESPTVSIDVAVYSVEGETLLTETVTTSPE